MVGTTMIEVVVKCDSCQGYTYIHMADPTAEIKEESCQFCGKELA